jgi:glycosyltransferase involved in cell wall biosynthesis
MDGYGVKEIDQLILDLELKQKIKRLGYISENEKFKLLSRATILVHPSSEEGSCFPMFEAWETMTATIVADTPLFREIGDTASLFFKSFNEQDLSKQIKLLTEDDALREKIIKNGQEKLKEMSWNKTAKEILKTLLQS